VQRFPDEAKLAGLEVADAAVDQLGRAAACSRGEIASVEEDHAEAAEGRVPRDRGTLDAAPHDEEVVCQSASLPSPITRTGARSGARF